MIAMGECPGPSLLGQGPPTAAPKMVTRGVEIMWHNQVLHKSHHLGWHRGVVFCWLCGAYGHSKVRKLTALCQMTPPTPAMAKGLKDIKAGKHPGAGWPQAEGTGGVELRPPSWAMAEEAES